MFFCASCNEQGLVRTAQLPEGGSAKFRVGEKSRKVRRWYTMMFGKHTVSHAEICNAWARVCTTKLLTSCQNSAPF